MNDETPLAGSDQPAPSSDADPAPDTKPTETEDEKLLEREPRAPGRPEFVDSDPWRALRILSEFVEGFDALAAVGPAITIFGSARVKAGTPDYELARGIARRRP